ncbi:MAG: hypothetical protein EZS28_009512 [Streblomastix strix]|uniref:Uncharacterized protein n=1 Tax=Streblomastix strix TaxID=222440 RepID=A0A5J4WJM2_9EUKA|nr:MAG: hypothetical protein EZS28_009512 [Streblomastix strix]
MKAVQAARQFRSGVCVLVVKRPSQVATVVNLDRTENDKADIKTHIFDIRTQLDENPTFESQSIKRSH